MLILQSNRATVRFSNVKIGDSVLIGYQFIEYIYNTQKLNFLPYKAGHQLKEEILAEIVTDDNKWKTYN
jgi:UDP-3-O-acyl-N-acetylglucosamine deacetylase